MRITRNLKTLNNLARPSAIAIGNFDGVHIGHISILNTLNDIAKSKNLSRTLITFEPHPYFFFKKISDKTDFLLTGLSSKIKLLEGLIDHLVIIPFNKETSQIEPKEFVSSILCKQMNSSHIVIGHDFVFGKNRGGNFELLSSLQKEFGYELTRVCAKKIDDQICSSSAIREAIRNADIAKANKMLGRNFSVTGVVEKGMGLARNLGFRTANFRPKNYLVRPKFGVYRCIARIDGLGKFDAIMNFGIKPTVSQSKSPIYEVHILNFDHDILGKKIIVEFKDFIREEKKFTSVEELRNQILSDIQNINIS